VSGRILAEAGDVSRSATKDKFASYNGTAPTRLHSDLLDEAEILS
jgi:hypothetical protein